MGTHVGNSELCQVHGLLREVVISLSLCRPERRRGFPIVLCFPVAALTAVYYFFGLVVSSPSSSLARFEIAFN